MTFKCTWGGAGIGDYSCRGRGDFARFLPNRPRPLSSFHTHARLRPVIVWQHLYFGGKFVLKASNWSRGIKKTSSNKKNLVAGFVTSTEAFQGGGLKIN